MNSPNYSMKTGSNNKKMTSFSHIKGIKAEKVYTKTKKNNNAIDRNSLEF